MITNPDVNFYHDVSVLDTQYLMPDKFKAKFKDFSKNSFSVLHLNIRSINKNFEAFTEFYLKLNHIFNVICFYETWASEENINKSSTFQLKTCVIQKCQKFAQRRRVMYIYS